MSCGNQLKGRRAIDFFAIAESTLGPSSVTAAYKSSLHDIF